MESLKHWGLLAKQRSVTMQNTWIFSSLSLWAHNTVFCHSDIGNRGNKNYCKATSLSVTLCSYGYNMHEFLSIRWIHCLYYVAPLPYIESHYTDRKIWACHCCTESIFTACCCSVLSFVSIGLELHHHWSLTALNCTSQMVRAFTPSEVFRK
jgi:hypothetical protein